MVYCCDDERIEPISQSPKGPRSSFSWAELSYCKSVQTMFLATQNEEEAMASGARLTAHPNMAQQPCTSQEIDCNKVLTSDVQGKFKLKVCCLPPSSYLAVKTCKACMLLDLGVLD